MSIPLMSSILIFGQCYKIRNEKLWQNCLVSVFFDIFIDYMLI